MEAESEDYTILSIRQAKDFEAGHIAGAINVPFGANMQEGLTAIDTEKPRSSTATPARPLPRPWL